MEKKLWETLQVRICEWATRLSKAAEEQQQPQLRSILFGRPPPWWLHCYHNGFTGAPPEGAEAEGEETRQLKVLLPSVREAFAPIYAVDAMHFFKWRRS